MPGLQPIPAVPSRSAIRPIDASKAAICNGRFTSTPVTCQPRQTHQLSLALSRAGFKSPIDAATSDTEGVRDLRHRPTRFEELRRLISLEPR